MTEPTRTFLDLERPDLEALLERLQQPRYRAAQILQWIHRRDASGFAAMTNLPKSLRERLAAEFPAPGFPETAGVETAGDGTTKLGLRLADGAVTETVLIPEPDEDDDLDEDESEPKHALTAFTQCLSTQVGCAFACAFCRSGSRGFGRHLTAAEILGQRLAARRELAGRGEIVRTVLMGIGEPLHNADRVFAALRLLTDPEAGGVSPRRITLSTVGVPEGIRRLGAEFDGRLGLAWSLHAADDEARARLLPAASRIPLADMVAAFRDYPLPPRRRLTVECVLVDGVNDSDRQARAIVRLLEGLRCKLNLIPFNPWTTPEESGLPAAGLRPPTAERLAAFRQVLTAAGLSAFVRKPRGSDALAACGQLLGASDLSRASRWDS